MQQVMQKKDFSIGRLIADPAFVFATAGITFASIVILFIPSIMDLTLSSSASLKNVELAILLFFLAEMLLRLAVKSQRQFKSIALLIDVLVVLPLFIELPERFGFENIILQTILASPAFQLLRSARILKLVQFIQYFQIQHSYGISQGAISSPIKAKFFTGMATLLYTVHLISGGVLLHFYLALTEAQISRRIDQIQEFSRTQGLLATTNAFSGVILKSDMKSIDENYSITNIDPLYVKTHYRYGRDYIQIDNIVPGGSVQISLRDLVRRQSDMESGVILLGFILLLGSIFSLNFYLERMILRPLEKARQVMKLRIMGEEIEESGVPIEPVTEVSRTIELIDIFYHKMRARKGETNSNHTESLTEQSRNP